MAWFKQMTSFSNEKLMDLVKRSLSSDNPKKVLQGLLKKEHGFGLVHRKNASRKILEVYRNEDYVRKSLALKEKVIGIWQCRIEKSYYIYELSENHQFKYSTIHNYVEMVGGLDSGVRMIPTSKKEEHSGVFIALDDGIKQQISFHHGDSILGGLVKFENGCLNDYGKMFYRI